MAVLVETTILEDTVEWDEGVLGDPARGRLYIAE